MVNTTYRPIWVDNPTTYPDVLTQYQSAQRPYSWPDNNDRVRYQQMVAERQAEERQMARLEEMRNSIPEPDSAYQRWLRENPFSQSLPPPREPHEFPVAKR